MDRDQRLEENRKQITELELNLNKANRIKDKFETELRTLRSDHKILDADHQTSTKNLQSAVDLLQKT